MGALEALPLSNGKSAARSPLGSLGRRGRLILCLILAFASLCWLSSSVTRTSVDDDALSGQEARPLFANSIRPSRPVPPPSGEHKWSDHLAQLQPPAPAAVPGSHAHATLPSKPKSKAEVGDDASLHAAALAAAAAPAHKAATALVDKPSLRIAILENWACHDEVTASFMQALSRTKHNVISYLRDIRFEAEKIYESFEW